MIEKKIGDKKLEAGRELERSMEAFLDAAAKFGSVYSSATPPTELAPLGIRVITILILNPEIHRPLTDKLVELAQKAGLPINSIDELVGVLARKGFRLIAQSQEAQSYQRLRKILPPTVAPQPQKT